MTLVLDHAVDDLFFDLGGGETGLRESFAGGGAEEAVGLGENI